VKYPEEAFVHYGLGVSRVIREDFDGSIPHFEEAVNLMPEFVGAWHNLGLSYRNKLDIPGAVNCARKVVKHGEPGDAFVIEDQDFLEHTAEIIATDLGLDLDDYLENCLRFDMAYLSMQEGDYERAIDGFKQVVAVEPSSYPALGNLGLCYSALGQRGKALEFLDRALAINPEYEVAAKNKPIIEAIKEGEKLNIPIQTVRWGLTGMKAIKPKPRRLTSPSDE
jgi:tetratricopeptide (TPR) repeat protein